jgi:hypothetical protein
MDEPKVKKIDKKGKKKVAEGGRQRQGGVPNPNDRSHTLDLSMSTGNGPQIKS